MLEEYGSSGWRACPECGRGKPRYNRDTGSGLMKFPYLSAVLSCLLFGLSLAVADDPKPSRPAHITNQTRVDIIRAFTSELVYLRTTFPMGQRGLVLKNGAI